LKTQKDLPPERRVAWIILVISALIAVTFFQHTSFIDGCIRSPTEDRLVS
jgi:hypothetical protein